MKYHFLEYRINYDEEYNINSFELNSICEDYITAQQCCDVYSKEIESLRNYIRFLENENKELTHKNEDKG